MSRISISSVGWYCSSRACSAPNSGSAEEKFHDMEEPFFCMYAPSVRVV